MEIINQFRSYLVSKKIDNPITLKNYLSDVRHFINWYEKSFGSAFYPTDLSEEIINLYEGTGGAPIMPGGEVNHSEKMSLASMKRRLSSLRQFSKYLSENGQIEENPFEAINNSKLNSKVLDIWHIAEFKDYLKFKKASDLTIKNYVTDIHSFRRWYEQAVETQIGETDFPIINEQVIEDYKNRLIELKSSAPRTVNRKLSSLRKFVEFALVSNFMTKEEIFAPSNVENVTLQANESEVLSRVSLNDIEDQKVKINYSSFPPVRLFQTLIIMPYLLIENLVAGKIIAFFYGNKPVVVAAKKLSNLASENIPSKPSDLLKVKGYEKEFYAPNQISLDTFPLYRKIWHHIRHTRPEWYRRYHNLPIVHYIHFAILIIFAVGAAIALYRNLVTDVRNPLFAAPTSPPRILSFQGRLTDNFNNPITTSTDIRFAIYDDISASGSALLWQEVHYSTIPDQDGIFSVLLGTNNPIPDNVFFENDEIYLGVTIEETSELTPRRRIASVPYAANSEALQGMLPITDGSAGTTNVVLALDSSGDLTIGGSANPTFSATGGQFTLSGDVLLLTTATGTNSNVIISPDGLGTIDLQKPLTNNSATGNLTPGGVEVNDKFGILATESAVAAFTLNNNGASDLFTASSSGVTRFTIENDGTLTIPVYNTAGGIFYANGAGTLAQTTSGLGGECLQSTGGGTPVWGTCGSGSQWRILSGAISPINDTLDLLIGSSATSSAKFAVINVADGTPTATISANSGNNSTFLTGNGNLGTTNSQTLALGGASTGNISLSPLNGVGTTIANGKLQITTTTSFDNTIDGFQQLGTGDLTITARNDLRFNFDSNNNGTNLVRFFANGNTTEVFRIDESGNIFGAAGSAYDTLTNGTLGIGTTNATTITIGRTGQGITLPAFTTNGGIFYANGSGVLAQTTAGSAGECLQSIGGGTPVWGTCGGGSLWRIIDGAISPINDTVDLLIGSNATSSAKFAVLNVNGSGPATATVSGNLIVMPHNGAGGRLGVGTTNPNNGIQVAGLINFDPIGEQTFLGQNAGAGLGIFSAYNIAIGHSALSGNAPGSGFNVAIGNNALSATASLGDKLANTAIGAGALSSAASAFNTAIGYQAGDNITTGSQNIVIGYDVDAPSATGVQQLTIGNLIFGTGVNGTGTTISNGNIGIGTNTPLSRLHVSGGNNGGNAALIVDQTGASSNDIFTASSSGTTMFVIKNDSSTGIGTANPQAPLHIEGTGPSIYISNVGQSISTNYFLAPGDDNYLTGVKTGDSGIKTHSSLGGFVLGRDGGNVEFKMTNDGLFGIGTYYSPTGVDPSAKFQVYSNLGTEPAASISAATSAPSLLVTNDGVGDIFAASNSGTPNFRITNNGDIIVGPNGSGKITAAVIDPYLVQNQYTTGNTQLTFQTMATSNGDFVFQNQSTELATLFQAGLLHLEVNGSAGGLQLGDDTQIFRGAADRIDISSGDSLNIVSGNYQVGGNTVIDSSGNATFNDITITGTCSGCVVGGDTPFLDGLGRIYPKNSTNDFLLGGQSTESAKFAVLNMNSGTPTASISATSSGNGVSLGGDGTIQSLRNNTLVLGGTTTGNIALMPRNGNGYVGIGTTSPTRALEVRQSNVGGVTELFLYNSDGTSAASNSRIRVTTNGASAGDAFAVFDVNGGGGWALGIDNSDSDKFKIGTNINSLGTNNILTIESGGNVGIGTTSPTSLLSVGSSSQFQVNSSGNIVDIGGGGHTIMDDSGNLTIQSVGSDLNLIGSNVVIQADFLSTNASSFFTNGMTISNGLTLGDFSTNGGLLYTNGTGQVAQTGAGTGTQCLLGGSTPTWGSCATGTAVSPFIELGGAIVASNTTLDFLLGGQSTDSAKFAVLNVNGSGPATASVSGNLIVMPHNGAGGRVGIGDETPDATLEVESTLNTSIGVTRTGGKFAGLLAGNTGGTFQFDKTGKFYIHAADSLTDASVDVDRNITLEGEENAYGFIGINNINPEGLLDIKGTGNIYFQHVGNTGIGTTSPIAALQVTRPLSFGTTGKALAIFDQIEDQDILAASAGGTTRFVINNDGNVGIGTALPSQALDVEGGNIQIDAATTLSAPNRWIGRSSNFSLSFDAGQGALLSSPANLLFQIDSDNSDADLRKIIFAKNGDQYSAGETGEGTHLFVINESGTLQAPAYNTNGGLLYTNGSGLFAQTGAGNSNQCLIGGTTPTWGSCNTGVGSSPFTESGGLIYPNNITSDFIVGGQATSSAKFSVLNISSGTPTASVSSTLTGNGLSLGGDGRIQSLRNNTLLLGGSTTGNIVLSPANGSGLVGINTGAGTIRATLEVGGTGNLAIFGNDSLVDEYISVRSNTAGVSFGLDPDLNGGNGAGLIQAGTSKALAFDTNNGTWGSASTPDMYIDTSGNVGIGTTTPMARLDVAASATVSGNLTFYGGTRSIQNTNFSHLNIGGSSTGNISINPQNGAGRVGINTSVPGATLDVNGSILLAGGGTIDTRTSNTLGIGTTNATTITIGNTTGAAALNFNVGTGGINFGDNAVTKTIDIGGVTNSAADTINISTNGTSADTISIGNSNSSTTLSLTGGDDWSIATNGNIATVGTLTFSGDTNLYRSAADTLATDDALQVGTKISLAGGITTFDNTAEVIQSLGTGDMTITARGDLRFNFDSNNNGSNMARFFANGNSTEVFRITEAGNIVAAAGSTYDTLTSGTLGIGTTTATTITIGRTGQGITLPGFDCSALANGGKLTTTSGGVLTCGNDGGSGSAGVFQELSGAIVPLNSTLDFMVGGQATSSAKFSITDIAKSSNTILNLEGSAYVRDLIAEDIALSGLSTSIFSAFAGFDGYTGFTGGIGTGGNGKDSITGAQRLDSIGNLKNIASIQAGETLLTSGGTFAAKVDYTAGNAPEGASIGDVNGDGYADIAVVNNSDNTVSIFINDGDGTFAAKVDYATDTGPRNVDIGDLNGDGWPDLAIANFGDTTFSVLLNDGDGTFAAKVDYAANNSPHGIAIGDLNGDGKNDVALTNQASDNISVFINNGDGTFAAKVDYAAGDIPEGIALGDVNGDGKADLAVANVADGDVSIYINNGNGTFAAKVDYATDNGAAGIAMGDVNGDGKADLAVANHSASNLSIMLNDGDGTFTESSTLSTLTSPLQVAIGDVTGDGKPDLASSNNSSADFVSVFINNGNGTFAAKVDYPVGDSPRNLAMGDVNNDGKVDLAVSNIADDDVSVLLNNARPILYAQASTGKLGIGTTSPTSMLHLTRPLTHGATGKALAIFDQIENQDIFTASASGTTRFVIKNDGSVGINTANPQAQFHMFESGTNDPIAIFENGSGGSTLFMSQGGTLSLKIINNPGNDNFITGSVAGDSGIVYNNAFGFLIGPENQNVALRIDNDNRVGLGTNSPIAEFHVTRNLADGATGKALAIFNQTENQDILTASASGSTRFRLANSGEITIYDDMLPNADNTINLGHTDFAYNTIYVNNVLAGGSDFAEYFKKANPSEQFEAGQLVCQTQNEGVTRCDSDNPNQRLLGAISDNAALVGGRKHAEDPNYVLVGLVGQLRIRVAGDVQVGDPLTISPITGVATKATNEGQIIGYAMESNASGKQRVATAIKTNYYNPNMALNYSGDNIEDFIASLNLSEQNGEFKLKDMYGNLVKRASAFSDIITANLKAGSANISSLTANVINGTTATISNISTTALNASNATIGTLTVGSENVVIAGTNLRDYVAGIVEEIIADNVFTNGDEIISPLASIDRINTNIISPLGDGASVEIEVKPENISINNTDTGEKVVDIDNSGNATFSGNLASESLSTNDATVSGTLSADRIIANTIDGLDDRISSVASNLISNNSSSTSGNLAQVDELEVGNIYADFGIYSEGLTVLGSTTTSSLTAMDTIAIGTGFIMNENSINTLGATLEIQPLRQGDISFMAGKVKIDTDGNVDINGNLNLAGTINAVEGVFNGIRTNNLATNIISPLPDSDLIIQLGNDGSASHSGNLRIANASGEEVVKISGEGNIVASGSATFDKLNFNLVGEALANTDTTAIATGSAGFATINRNKPELTIYNENITKDSLIYITPFGNTQNKVLHLLRQVPQTETTDGSFTVGISGTPATIDIQFNWLIVN